MMTKQTYKEADGYTTIGFYQLSSGLRMINKEKKYKYTKQLLKIAIEAGQYRNQDIALKAGLSNKSVAQVSGWRNGRKKATERQMAYFIKEYEHLLKRKLEYLFYKYISKISEWSS